MSQHDDGYDDIMRDQAEDAATRDHEQRLRGQDAEPTETPAEFISECVGSESENYLWVETWMGMLSGPADRIKVQVWDPLLKCGGAKELDAETARTVARYLFEAAHNLDLRAKEREEEST